VVVVVLVVVIIVAVTTTTITTTAITIAIHRGPQRFQILPLVLQVSPEQQPSLYTVPRQYYGEVPLVHPKHSWFAALGLKWYSTPAVSNMEMSVGGIKYTGLRDMHHVVLHAGMCQSAAMLHAVLTVLLCMSCLHSCDAADRTCSAKEHANRKPCSKALYELRQDPTGVDASRCCGVHATRGMFGSVNTQYAKL